MSDEQLSESFRAKWEKLHKFIGKELGIGEGETEVYLPELIEWAIVCLNWGIMMEGYVEEKYEVGEMQEIVWQ